MESLNNKLKSAGIKPTFQRLKILEYIEKNMNHPTVDMIYRGLVTHIPTMSRTTVYNTVHMFVKHGIISPLMITGTEVRFEPREEQHHHFFCEKCGSIIDLAIQCPIFRQEHIDGHYIQEFHGYFKGICSNCAAKG